MKEKNTIPLYLNKVNSDKKAVECSIIFEKAYPTPSELSWLIKFLKFVGYSKTELQNIICKHAQWSDYSEAGSSSILITIFG